MNFLKKINLFNFFKNKGNYSNYFNLMQMESFTQNKDRLVLTTEDIEVFNSYLNVNQGRKLVGTHSGCFHADEVLASTIAKYSNEFKDFWMVRSRNYEILNKADLVCDVGGIYDPATHRYDHHMKEFTHNFDEKMKIKMSSAGLIFKHLGMEIIENILKAWNIHEENKENIQKIYDKVYLNFIAYVDGADNGINQYPDDIQPRYANTTCFGSRIGRMNPEWNEKADQSERFKLAQDIAEDEFLHQVKFVAKSYLPAYSIVKGAIENRFKAHESGKIIVFEKSCPWKDLLFVIEEEMNIKNEIIFAIYKASETDFRVQTVPITLGNFKFRKGLHEHWRGMEKDKLAGISGIEDIIFVHTSGFIGGAKSFPSALKMAETSLNM
jgi:uncharacterized UPF0160 family protein